MDEDDLFSLPYINIENGKPSTISNVSNQNSDNDNTNKTRVKMMMRNNSTSTNTTTSSDINIDTKTSSDISDNINTDININKTKGNKQRRINNTNTIDDETKDEPQQDTVTNSDEILIQPKKKGRKKKVIEEKKEEEDTEEIIENGQVSEEVTADKLVSKRSKRIQETEAKKDEGPTKKSKRIDTTTEEMQEKPEVKKTSKKRTEEIIKETENKEDDEGEHPAPKRSKRVQEIVTKEIAKEKETDVNDSIEVDSTKTKKKKEPVEPDEFEVKYNTGDIVWVQIFKYYPWWPCVIVNLENIRKDLRIKLSGTHKKKGGYIVFYYGTYQFDFANSKSMKSYSEHREKLGKQVSPSYQVDLDLAVLEADDDIKLDSSLRPSLENCKGLFSAEETNKTEKTKVKNDKKKAVDAKNDPELDKILNLSCKSEDTYDNEDSLIENLNNSDLPTRFERTKSLLSSLKESTVSGHIDADTAIRILNELENMQMDLSELKNTGAAEFVSGLRKCENIKVSIAAKELRNKWKTTLTSAGGLQKVVPKEVKPLPASTVSAATIVSPPIASPPAVSVTVSETVSAKTVSVAPPALITVPQDSNVKSSQASLSSSSSSLGKVKPSLDDMLNSAGKPAYEAPPTPPKKVEEKSESEIETKTTSSTIPPDPLEQLLEDNKELLEDNKESLEDNKESEALEDGKGASKSVTKNIPERSSSLFTKLHLNKDEYDERKIDSNIREDNIRRRCIHELHTNFECMDAAIVVEGAVFKIFCINNDKATDKYLKEINKITFSQKITYLQHLQDLLHPDVFSECEPFFNI